MEEIIQIEPTSENQLEQADNVQPTTNLKQNQNTFMLQQPVVTLSEKQVNQETALDEELEDLQLSKIREHDTASLTRLLRIETELLIKAKVKEDITERTLQSFIQEAQAEQNALDQEYTRLKSSSEELRQKVNMEMLQRSQMQKEIKTTEEIKNTLSQYYGTLDQNYKNLLSDIEILEREQENQISNYNLKKQQMREAIAHEDEKLLEMQHSLEEEEFLFESEKNKKIEQLKELNNTNSKNKDKLDDLTTQNNDLKCKLSKETEKLGALKSENAELKNALQKVTSEIDELTAQKLEKEVKHKEALDAKKQNLDDVKKSLQETKQLKLALQESLTAKIDITNEQQARYSKLEDEFVNLSSNNKSLQAAIDEAKAKSTQVCNEFTSELEKAKNCLNDLKTKLDTISEERETQGKILQNTQWANEELERKISELKTLKEKLTEENKTKSVNLSDLREQKIAVQKNTDALKASLQTEKENYAQNEATYQSKLSEVNNKLQNTHIELENLNCEFDLTTEQLNNQLSTYKKGTEQAYQETILHNREKLQQLSGELSRAQSKLAAAKENSNLNLAVINKKRALKEKLQNDWQKRHKTDHLGSSEVTKDTAESSNTFGILKSPKKPTISPKKVTFERGTMVWQLSDDSSTDMDLTGARGSQQLRRTEDEFDKLITEAIVNTNEASK